MLKPEQIPAVVSAYFRSAPQAMTTEEALCAAINAWPDFRIGMAHTVVGKPGKIVAAKCIFLPLPQEAGDE